jgi:hypothetical protein
VIGGPAGERGPVVAPAKDARLDPEAPSRLDEFLD